MAAVEDYDFSGADAGAADTYPIEAGQIRKGGLMMIKGQPCKVSEVSTSKTGKHGSAKCNFTAYNIFNNKKLEEVRDLFIFGAWVGLRFSDFSNIKPENIIQIDGDYFIKTITQKTIELVIIPCNPVIMEIFEKYADRPNKLPKTISNQKFNDYIKDVCKLAELNEVGRISARPKDILADLVSSHTARRSFATNYYLQGFPTIDLMKITGHKTERSFLKYIRVSKLDTAKRLSDHIKANWSKKLLSVQ